MRASILLSILLSVVVQAQEQWYDSGSEMAFALTSAANGSSTDLYFTLSAPEKAGWGAVGIGGGMGGALMFLIYPGMATDCAYARFTGSCVFTDFSFSCHRECENSQASVDQFLRQN